MKRTKRKSLLHTWFQENKQKHLDYMRDYFHTAKNLRVNALRTLRQEFSLTQCDLALLLKVNRRTIVRLESQQQNISPQLAEKIGKVFQQPPLNIFPHSMLGESRKHISTPTKRSR